MRWLVSYADFITLLMVFFIIMYSMSRVDAKKLQALAGSLRMAFFPSGGLLPGAGAGLLPVAGGGQDPAGYGGAVDGLSGPGVPTALVVPLETVGQDVAESLAELIRSGDVRVVQSERGLAIQLQGSVLFALGSATVRPGAEQVLSEVARALARVPNVVAIEGYTDDLPIHTAEFPSNWELSTRRATAVLRYLVEREGLPPERFIAVGYGEYRPLYPNRSEAERAKNRRVDIVLLKTAPLLNVGREMRPRP